MHRTRFALLVVALIAVTPVVAQQSKKVLDAAAYEIWRSVRTPVVSNDGHWVLYTLALQDGDGVVEIKSSDGSKTYTIPRGSNAQFTQDSKFVVATILPKADDVKKAKRAKAKPDDMPKNSLVTLNLAADERTELEKVTSYQMPSKDSGWIVYRPEVPKPAPAAKPAETPKTEAPKTEAPKTEAPKTEEKKSGLKPDHKAGDPLILRNIATGKEERIENVTSFRWVKDGSVLAYTVATTDGAGDGVVWYDLGKGQRKQVFTGAGHYPKLAVNDQTKALAFETDKDSYTEKKPTFAIYVYQPEVGKVVLAAKEGSDGLLKSFVPSENGTFQFSEKGGRLIFGTAIKAEEEKKDDTPDDEKVSVDIWTYQDKQMMPQQLMQAAQERMRTFDAVYDLSSGKIIQLENPDRPSSQISNKGDGDFALVITNLPYAIQSTWGEGFTDYYLVDLTTGQSKTLATKFSGDFSFSNTGKYLLGFDDVARDYFTVDPRSLKRVSLSKDIPAVIYDEQVDTPTNPNQYGAAGWTKDDKAVLVYDRFDIWLCDPTGASRPLNLTSGSGRSWNTRLRYLRTNPEEDYIDLSKPIMLSGFQDKTKASGFYTLVPGRSPDKLMMLDKLVAYAGKAKNADTLVFTRMDFDESNNLWATNTKFESPKQLSDANPQQSQYNWGKAELVEWISNDGVQLQGVLIKPENFDPTKKYPMITYFYERSSDTLHQYYSPAPSASTVNMSMYASSGYVMFIPDIPYKVGYPGESAISAILPGVQAVVARGFVDPKRLGIQGQSWGGYQVGYMVTETNMFAAACAGAPVSDMVSAYGGIRWESGVSREGQYEHGQSRIGGSLWQNPLRYIENSPIFYVDKIQTPLLIMSNDKDGAVPWYQGIEYFSALRRLNKPAWLVVYNEEAHNLVQRKNRKDWSVRMQQFFDHYLKGAPMPVWMSQGIAGTMKGKTYGFELPPVAKPNGG